MKKITAFLTILITQQSHAEFREDALNQQNPIQQQLEQNNNTQEHHDDYGITNYPTTTAPLSPNTHLSPIETIHRMTNSVITSEHENDQ
jgi:hypothetical protein